MSQAGFTLVETVVASAVLALVLAAAYAVLGTGFGQISVARDLARGARVAQGVLAEAPLAVAAGSGTSEGVSPEGFHWTRTLQPLAPQGVGTRPYLVRVEVEWPSRAGPQRLALESVVPAQGISR